MQDIQEKTSKASMALEKKLQDLVVDARKRRAYIHALAMKRFTPKQYERAIPILARQGYGVNVFPMHHVHPPLSMALLGQHIEAVDALLRAGADPNMTYPTNEGRMSAMHVVVESLIKYQKQPRVFQKYKTMLLALQKGRGDFDATMYPQNPMTFRQRLNQRGVVL